MVELHNILKLWDFLVMLFLIRKIVIKGVAIFNQNEIWPTHFKKLINFLMQIVYIFCYTLAYLSNRKEIRPRRSWIQFEIVWVECCKAYFYLSIFLRKKKLATLDIIWQYHFLYLVYSKISYSNFIKFNACKGILDEQ